MREITDHVFGNLFPGLSKDAWPNSANVNLYRDGRQGVGWHVDDESLFRGRDSDCPILSVSLGAPREFWIALKRDGNSMDPDTQTVTEVDLCDGDVMTMEGRMQQHCVHFVPKVNPREPLRDERINITFRWVREHRFRCPIRRSQPTSVPRAPHGLFGEAHGRKGKKKMPQMGLASLFGSSYVYCWTRNMLDSVLTDPNHIEWRLCSGCKHKCFEEGRACCEGRGEWDGMWFCRKCWTKWGSSPSSDGKPPAFPPALPAPWPHTGYMGMGSFRPQDALMCAFPMDHMLNMTPYVDPWWFRYGYPPLDPTIAAYSAAAMNLSCAARQDLLPQHVVAKDSTPTMSGCSLDGPVSVSADEDNSSPDNDWPREDNIVRQYLQASKLDDRPAVALEKQRAAIFSDLNIKPPPPIKEQSAPEKSRLLMDLLNGKKVEVHAKSALTGKTPLKHRWCLWQLNEQSADWTSAHQLLRGQITTPDGLWGAVGGVQPPSALSNEDYSVFHEGMMPAREDPHFIAGGRWIFAISTGSVQRGYIAADRFASALNKSWKVLLKAVVCDGHSTDSCPICGVVVSVRKGPRNDGNSTKSAAWTRAKLSVWLSDAKDTAYVESVGNILHRALVDSMLSEETPRGGWPMGFEDFQRKAVTVRI